MKIHPKSRNYRKNHNKTYVGILVAGIAILIGAYVYGNYDITVDKQKVEQIIPVIKIESTFNDLYQNVPVESIEKTIEKISDDIPIKIEPKQETLESKLMDCTVYKKQYYESTKNMPSTPDNMAVMMGEAMTNVQKTRACEEYNRKILSEHGVLGHCKLPPITLDLENKRGDAGLSYKEMFIKYCGQEEWDYINNQ